MIETTGYLAAKKKILVEKTQRQRDKVLSLEAELKELQVIGHARAPGVEVRLRRAIVKLCRLYFEGMTGADLLNRKIGPADEPPEMWSRKTI